MNVSVHHDSVRTKPPDKSCGRATSVGFAYKDNVGRLRDTGGKLPTYAFFFI
jgi:hypothetical protein